MADKIGEGKNQKSEKDKLLVKPRNKVNFHERHLDAPK